MRKKIYIAKREEDIEGDREWRHIDGVSVPFIPTRATPAPPSPSSPSQTHDHLLPLPPPLTPPLPYPTRTPPHLHHSLLPSSSTFTTPFSPYLYRLIILVSCSSLLPSPSTFTVRSPVSVSIPTLSPSYFFIYRL